jgi:O-antigen ligase
LDQLAEYGVIGFGPFLAFVLVGTVKATRTFVSDRSAGNAGQVVFFLCVWLFGFANPLVFIESASIPVVLAICAIWTSPSWPSSRVRPAALVSGAVGKVGRVAAVDSESGLVVPSEDMRLGPLA